MSRPTFEVADIVQAQGNRFVDCHRKRLRYQQLNVLRAIARCRTSALGDHLDACSRCGHQAISYNSCRNRHCPKCQAQARQHWLAAREQELLDVSYFHVVLTLPATAECAGSYQPSLEQPKLFAAFLRTLFRQDLVVYAKPSFGGAESVLRYLGRYTHRVAISNHRLLDFDGESVTFRWKDYAHGNKQRKMTLSAVEFLRRFVQHILPLGFVRIRYFGFLANRWRARLIPCAVNCRGMLRPLYLRSRVLSKLLQLGSVHVADRLCSSASD